jgi:site-specific DNA-methyltransferase (adenine-specific)
MKCKATLLIGDVRNRLTDLDDESVDCIITSPPYFGLKDYEVAEQIGLEARASEYLSTLESVFVKALRVLKPSGVMFINIGDSYATYRDGKVPAQSSSGSSSGRPKSGAANRNKKYLKLDGFKHKELMGIPWRFALLMQKHCYLRQEIIWSKTTYTPERVRDRFVKSHEHLFLFTKRENYWFDGDAVRIEAEGGDKLRNTVWNVAPSKYRGAHFATFPPELVEPCVKSGCPIGGVVLDVFNGSGTTGLVSLKRGRNYIGIDLNKTYIKDVAMPRIMLDKYIDGDYTVRRWKKSKRYKKAYVAFSKYSQVTLTPNENRNIRSAQSKNRSK